MSRPAGWVPGPAAPGDHRPSWLWLVPEGACLPRDGVLARLDGTSCRTRAGLLAQWGEALEFPPYYSHTWDGMADCLKDAIWLHATGRPARTGLAIEVASAQYLLSAEPATEMGVLLRLLRDTAYATGTRWPVPETPGLTILLRCPAARLQDLFERLRAGWLAAGSPQPRSPRRNPRESRPGR